jgi:hypothetical protein
MNALSPMSTLRTGSHGQSRTSFWRDDRTLRASALPDFPKAAHAVREVRGQTEAERVTICATTGVL